MHTKDAERVGVRRRLRFFCTFSGLLGFALAACHGHVSATPPPTRYWEGEHLESVRQAGEKTPEPIAKSIRQLSRAADQALGQGPYSVVDKAVVPPSGDKHDYLSLSRYWWPNPDTEDGLPYVRRDGVVNYEAVREGDRVRIGAFSEDFKALALAAFLIDRERYATHARELLRVWFLEEATRMSPHLEFAQGVPGRADGRSPGIIDTRCFIWLLDGVVLLDHMGALPREDHDKLSAWFREYLDWLMSSELGEGERLAKNNHGAWFAAQSLRIALFVGDHQLAHEIVESSRRRLAVSIKADGSQPEELRRTRSLHYSLFSLTALAAVARMAESIEVDLWKDLPDGGSSLLAGLRYATPHMVDQADWEHPSIEPYRLSDQGLPLFHLAATRFAEPEFLRVAKKAPSRVERKFLSVTPVTFRAD